MAGEAFSTTAPNIPSEGGAKGGIETALKPVEGNPAFALDDPYVKAVGALNHQLATTLATDNEILPERYADYENALRAGETTEQKGFAAQGGREMARGAANSGFARIDRRNLASEDQFRKNAAAERFTTGIGALTRGAAKEEWAAKEGLAKANTGGETWLANKVSKEQLEAKPPPPPGAAATAAAAFSYPGGRNANGETKDEWVKNNSKYVRNPTGAPLINRSGGAPQRAKGGPVEAGHAYIVGEKGPEIMVPKTGGQILPNHAKPKAAQIRRRAIERLGRWNRG